MNRYSKVALIYLLTVGITFNIVAQDIPVSGRVVDGESSDPLPGVTVLEVGTVKGTTTDAEGRFRIIVSKNASLQFSFIGYKPTTINVVDQTTLNIELQQDVTTMEELVVIGYGTTTRQKITGAVASVTPESFKAGPILTVSDALQGNAAGLMIQSNGGQPGASARINIRGINSLTGTTSPLIVVDGFPLFDVATSGGGDFEKFTSQLSPLSFINPADIKSIEVLKDASATAIYGNRGANGVILITTNKGGQVGSRITYSNFFGVRKLSKQLDVLNFEEYARYQHAVNPGNRFITDPSGAMYDFDFQDVPSVNWQDKLFRTGSVQNHSLSIQNSGEKGNAYFSLAALNDKSILIESDLKKYNAKLGFEQNHNKAFSFGGDLSFNYIEYQGLPTEGRDAAASGVTIQALTAVPYDLTDPKTYKEFVEDASVPQVDVNNHLVNNPGNIISAAKDTDLKKSSSRFIGNAYAMYNITENLSLRISGAGDVYNLTDRLWYPSTTGIGNFYDGLAILSSTQSINFLNENILTYRRRFGTKNDINLTAGYTQQYYQYENVRAQATSFDNQTLGYKQMSLASSFITGSQVDKLRMDSYLFRGIYTYDEKVSLTVSARLDGTSRFLKDKWGDFYSAGVTYDLKRDYLSSSELLSALKLRASYGQVGNASVSTSGAFAQLGTTNYTFNNVLVVGVSPANLANESLSWESTSEYNFGVDFGFGSGKKLTGSVDYYTKKTNDLILSTPIPNISGFNTAFQNVGSIQNRGLELTIQSLLMSRSSFSWDIAANFTFSKGKVLNLSQNGAPIYISAFIGGSYSNQFILREGGPMGEIFGYKSDGIYTDADFDASGNLLPGVVRGLSTPLPGDLKLKDLNGDGDITDADRTTLGTTMPKFFGGITNTFKYGNFDLRLIMQYYLGNSILNASKTRYARYEMTANNVSSDVLNRWTPENRNSTQYARIANTITVDKYVENGSFVRASNVKLGYTLPAKFLVKGIKSLNVFISADNLFVLSNYTGYDPEVSTNQGSAAQSSALTGGLDFGAFPRARTYMGGITVIF
jgi:TonB-linked SusC/RagA family outer membrane protein